MDGILCEDPREDQNDDGDRYLEFLRTATPRFIPRVMVGHIVTSRLGKYRKETEQWLAEHGVQYGALHMLEGVTAEERRRRRLHAVFKADVFQRYPEAWFFVESDPSQAAEITNRTGRSVYCPIESRMYTPSLALAVARGRISPLRAAWRLVKPLIRGR
jgi:uncharacterized HAD superfamily protein